MTGSHPYDVSSFNKMLRSIPEIDYDIQSIEEFCANLGEYTDKYDVVLFYNMTKEVPQEEKAWDKIFKKPLEDIAERGQGIFILHHAILAFKEWKVWSDICGIENRKSGYHGGQHVQYQIMNKEHPITKGLQDFEMIDETYTMECTGEGSQVLISTEHPNSMKTIAWTREYKNSKVFCYESGHGHTAFEDENFRSILKNGILWLSGKI